jgi:hypothetical protein
VGYYKGKKIKVNIKEVRVGVGTSELGSVQLILPMVDDDIFKPL